MTKPLITKPGYYARTPDGALQPFDGVAIPDVVICRRLVDFPQSTPPRGAQIGACARCGVIVAWNPAGPHQDRPRSCLQCAGIQPLPIEES